MPLASYLRQTNPAYKDFSDDEIAVAVRQIKPEYGEYSPEEVRAVITAPGSESIYESLFAKQAKPDSTWGDRGTDLAIDASKGVVELGRSAVGLAGMGTGGLVTSGMRALGYDPEQTTDFLSSLYSDARKYEEAEYQQASGALDSAKALVTNPAMFGGKAIETIPGMMGMIGVAKKFASKAAGAAYEAAIAKGATEALAKEAATKAAAIAGTRAAAIAEGTQQGGSSFDQLTEDEGVSLGRAYVASIGSGVTTGATALVGGTLGRKLGIGDIEGGTVGRFGRAGNVAGGAVQEGLLEEAPQSATEQMWQNWALGNPVGEGVEKAAVTGGMLGSAMGGGVALVRGPGEQASSQPPATTPTQPVPSPLTTDPKAAERPMAELVAEKLAKLTTPPAPVVEPPTSAGPSAPLPPGVIDYAPIEPTTDLVGEPVMPSDPGVPITPDRLDIESPTVRSQQPNPDPLVVMRDGEIETEMARLESEGLSEEAMDLRARVIGYEGQPQKERIVTSSGKPFKTDRIARAAIKLKRLSGYKIIKVKGGFALEPVQSISTENSQPINRAVPEAPGYLRGRLGKPEYIRRKDEIDAAYEAAYPSTESQPVVRRIEAPANAQAAQDQSPDLDVAKPTKHEKTQQDKKATQPAKAETRTQAEQVTKTGPVAEQPKEGESWVIRNKETGEVIMETYDRKKVDALNTAKYEAVPVLQHLQEFNRKVRGKQPAKPNIFKRKSEREREASEKPALVKSRTLYGDTVYVRQSDLDGTDALIPEFTATGARKGKRVHRGNLDPTGEKQAALNREDADNPLSEIVMAKDGVTFANELVARRELNRRGIGDTHEIVKASELKEGIKGFVLRRAKVESKPATETPAKAKKPDVPMEAASKDKGQADIEDVAPAQPSEPAQAEEEAGPDQTKETDTGVAMYSRRIHGDIPTAHDYIVPETPEFDGDMTGDIAYTPQSAEKNGVEQLPIRLTVGVATESHRGFGIKHINSEAQSDKRRMPPNYTDDAAENYARHVTALARGFTEIYEDGRHLIFRSARMKEALVVSRQTDRSTGEAFYSVVSLRPAEKAVWGEPVWFGRTALPNDRLLQSRASEPSPSQTSQRLDRQMQRDQTSHYDISPVDPDRQPKVKTKITVKKRRAFTTGEAAESRKGQKMAASSVEDIESSIEKPLSRLRKMFTVNVVQSADDVPGNHPEDIRGVYMNGAVWIVADNVSAKDAAEVLAHESVGHLGLETILGRTAFMDMVKIIKQQKLLGNKRVLAIIADLKKSYTDADGNYNLYEVQEAREVLAHIAEGKAELLTGSALQKLYQRIKAKVRLWLASKGFGNVEDALIDSLIVRASRFVQSDYRGAGTMEGALAYSRKAQAEIGPMFYSQMQRGLADKLPGSGSAHQIKQAIQAYATKGEFKAEELEWSGVEQWLDSQLGKKVSKSDVLAFLRANEIQVTETVLPTPGKALNVEVLEDDKDTEFPYAVIVEGVEKNRTRTRETAEQEAEAVRTDPDTRRLYRVHDGAKSPKFAKYVTPGGANYRELLLTLPAPKIKEDSRPTPVTELPDGFDVTLDRTQPEGSQFAVTPPGQLHGRPWNGRHATAEAAKADAIQKYNAIELEAWQATTNAKIRDASFTSSHFDEPNILAHIRFDERTDASGRKVLHVAEIQSDWHQRGRKIGYQTDSIYKILEADGKTWYNSTTDRELAEEQARKIGGTVVDGGKAGVPNAPFKTTWPLLAFKRMIRYASENGFDAITWDTGEVQADRYDLSKQVKDLKLFNYGDGNWDISARDNNDKLVDIATRITESKLADYVGKEVAKKAVDTQTKRGWNTYSGVDIKVGGKGMAGFYDNILPKEVNRYVKKWGAKAGETTLVGGRVARYPHGWVREDADGKQVAGPFPSKEAAESAATRVHSLDITASMRESALQGQPLYSRRAKTDTEAFRKWFGDSKVVDENGEPLVVYHGTSADFDTFDESAIGSVFEQDKEGFFFTSIANDASQYATNAARKGGSANIVPTYLSIQNPLIFDSSIENFDGMGAIRYLESVVEKDAAIAEAKEAGNDGVMIINRDNVVPEVVVIAFRDAQIKSAIGNTIGPSNPSILYSRKAKPEEGSASLATIADRVLAKPERKTVLGKIKRAIDAHGENFGVWAKQGMIDEFSSIAEMEKKAKGMLLDAKESAYKAAAFSKNSNTVLEVAMHFGAVQYRNGGVEIKEGTKGLMEILEPLAKGDLMREWELWAGAVRAKRLLREGKERNYTASDVAEIESLVVGDKLALFKQVHQDWIAFNKATLDFSEAAGLVDAEQRAQWERDDYVPFHRVSELEGKQTEPRGRGGLSGQSSGIRKLEGGVEKISIVESMVRNTAHMIDASMKNEAMRRTIALANEMGGIVTEVKDARISKDEAKQRLDAMGIDYDPENIGLWKSLLEKHDARTGTVTVSDNGKTKRYIVHDPLLLASMTSLGPTGVDGIMKVLRIPKRLLTDLITSDPSFALRNFIRDTLSTWTTVHAGKRNPLSGAIKGVIQSYQNSDVQKAMMAQGVGGSGFYDTSPEGARAHLDKMAGKGKTITTLGELWQAYRKVLGTTENANRIAVYEASLKSGASKAEAAYQAMDVLNFSRHGEFKAVRIIIQLVPFMNSRIQGLDKLWRGAKEGTTEWYQFNRNFMIKGTILTAATLALLAANWDEDEYWDLEEWERDTYYHFFIDGEHYRMPKPFEVGAVFSTIPERLFEQFREDADMKLLGKRMLHMIADTFALDPTPQFAKPALEMAQNRNSFTGRDILSMGMKFAAPEAQYSPYTSKTFIEIADAMPDSAPEWMRSPARLQHLFRGYFGTLGGYALLGSDYATRTLTSGPDRPSARLRDVPVVNSFVRDGVGTNKQVGRVYEMSKTVNQINAAIKKYRDEGRTDKARELELSNKEKLQTRLALNRTTKKMSEISSKMKKIYDHPFMSPDEKRRRIDVLIEDRNTMAKQVSERYFDRY